MFRYFGSKSSTSSRISALVEELTPSGTVADAFGGLGTIGAQLRRTGYKVTTCDALNFPHAFQIARIECGSKLPFNTLRERTGIYELDQIESILNRSFAPRSWFVREYAQERKFFTPENAIRIAGAWHQIKRWSDDELLSRRESAFLVASLLNSMDAVANTAGTYYAHLKEFDRKAVKEFQYVGFPVDGGRYVGKALHGDALSCLSGKKFDVLYLDPPYNSRNYACYYHLPESMSLLRRPNTNASRVSGVPITPHPATPHIRNGMKIEYIEQLASNVDWKWLIVHYCDGAAISLSDMREMLRKFGKLNEFTLPTLGYTTNKQKRTVDHHVFVVTASTTRATGKFCAARRAGSV